MTISILLRSVLNSCKMRPSANLTQFSKLSTASILKCNFVREDEKCLIMRRTPSTKLGQIARQFSATPVLKAAGGHDHSKMWSYEKAVSFGLLGICPLGIMFPNVLFDILMAVASVMHMHWGFEAIVVDYVRPIIFGNFIPKIALALVYVLSIFTLVGLFNLTFNNTGIGNGIRLLWKI